MSGTGRAAGADGRQRRKPSRATKNPRYKKSAGLAAGALIANADALVERILQRLTGPELGQLGRRNLNGLTRAGITPLGSGAVGDTERTEAHEADFITPLQAPGDSVDDAINSFRRITLRHTRLVRNGGNEIVLVHELSPCVQELKVLRRRLRPARTDAAQSRSRIRAQSNGKASLSPEKPQKYGLF